MSCRQIPAVVVMWLWLSVAAQATEFDQPFAQDFSTASVPPCGESVALFSDFCGDADRDTVVELFGGLDGSKQTQDFGVNANFGGRVSVNVGTPLGDSGFGLQLGTSWNSSDNAVQVFERVGGPTTRQQMFSTVGLFRRTENWTAALAYDFLYQDSYDEFSLSQWRGSFGVPVTSADEVGVWLAIGGKADRGTFAATPVRLSPISQGSLYWRHIWQSGVRTTFWGGMSEGHGEVNLALGDLPPVNERIIFGADLHVPLNDRMALYGEANFLTPADTGTVDAYLGLVIYLDPIARHRDRKTFAPVLPVSNSTRFAVDLSR